MNYYNEIDPHAAQWLRNLIAAGEIPHGVVDERSIEDVTPADLAPYTQCHFFAGIAGWSAALALADWPEDRPVWTGSCPCQPFSTAGKQAGFDDERHLWPAWHWLIQECRPAAVFGEQVASKVAEPWLDLVSTDLEGLGYAFGSVAFPSAGVGSPHIRDRTYWVAYRDYEGLEGRPRVRERSTQLPSGADGLAVLVENPDSGRRTEDGLHATGHRTAGAGQEADRRGNGSTNDGPLGLVLPTPAGPTNGHWAGCDWLACRDGRWRPVEPGTFPLAHGVPGRVGRLRAYGNAINPYQAAEFIRSTM